MSNTGPVENLESDQQLPARYKRKLTDARREQNRRSQRVWREKQKQRREEEIKTRVRQELERREKRQPQAESLPRSVEAEAGAGAEAETSSTSLQPADEITIPEPILPLNVAVYYYAPPVPDVEDHRYSWPVPDETQRMIYTLPPGVTPRTTALTSLASSASSSAHPSPLSLYYSRSSLSSHGSSGVSSRPSMPSPYLNHLQLVGESCFGATMAIAQSLGISVPAYINDHASPFSTGSNADIHTIPVDLRPTAFQLIIPHPCYLDCIPFPHFRSMAIYLASVKRLDHGSLFLDMMHDGMICWGRERASTQYGRSMRDGVAWTKRSWEVRRWFWRKWSWIARMSVEGIDAGLDASVVGQPQAEDLDDEDGMLSGSQWWWSLRDEDEGHTVSQGLTSMSSNVPGQEEEEFGSFLSSVGTYNVGIRRPEEEHLVVHWE